MTMRCRAALAWRSPAGLRRCLVVRPLLASMGATPHRWAKAASECSRSGLSPAVVSSWAAQSGPTPKRARVRGAAVRVRVARSVSACAISSVRWRIRRARRRSAVLVAWVGSARSVPGRRATQCASRVAWRSSVRLARSAAGAVTMRLSSWLSATVRHLTAAARTVRSTRMASTMPVPALGVALASPDCTAAAALIASCGSDLPRRRRWARSGRLTSTTRTAWAVR
jgi:hypothetical protein